MIPIHVVATGFTLATDPDTVRAPDVAFVSRERIEAVGEVEEYWPGAPDLAIEVISPNDSQVEVEEKVFDWLEAGTKWCSPSTLAGVRYPCTGRSPTHHPDRDRCPGWRRCRARFPTHASRDVRVATRMSPKGA
jgi:hypothetical protein